MFPNMMGLPLSFHQARPHALMCQDFYAGLHGAQLPFNLLLMWPLPSLDWGTDSNVS